MGPCARMLLMNSPVCPGDSIGLQQAPFSLCFDIVRKPIPGIVAIYHSINNSMDDVNALRAKFASQALRERP